MSQLVRVPAPRCKVNRGLGVAQAKATLKAAVGKGRILATWIAALTGGR
jgi:hypothetical protein